MIPMLAATLIIYLLAELAGVSPVIPIAIAITGEIAWTVIKKARTPRRPRRPIPSTQPVPARSVAYRPLSKSESDNREYQKRSNVTARAVTNANNGDLHDPTFTLFTQLLNEPDPRDEGSTRLL